MWPGGQGRREQGVGETGEPAEARGREPPWDLGAVFSWNAAVRGGGSSTSLGQWDVTLTFNRGQAEGQW